MSLANNQITLTGSKGSTSSVTLPTASANTLGGVKVGTNLSINNGVLSAIDTTYSAATTSAAGLMSAEDKTKLNGIAAGANAYSLPAASADTLGGVKVGTNLSISDGVLSATDTTYESKAAVNGGTDLSLVTTGEKFKWNMDDYCTCSTGASTADKTASLDGFVLDTGASVKVKFTNTNTAANPSLNINSTGAKPIMLYGVTAVGTTPSESWNDGAVVEFVYDGTNWIISDAVSQNAIEIPANADLNDYATVGEYFCASAANVQTLTNCPVTSSFNMIVGRRSTSYIVQQIETGAALCTRTSTSSGWNDWHNFVRSDSGVFTEDVTINDESTTTSSEVSILTLGNSTATGTVGNSNGMIRMYGQGDKYLNIRPTTTSGTYTTANRAIMFPDADGTVMLNTGGTFTGTVYINRADGTTSATGVSTLWVGNNTPTGTAGNSKGQVVIYGNGANYVNIQATNATGNRTLELPDLSGTIMTNKGGTFSGEIIVDEADGTAGSSGWSGLKLGNNKPIDTAGNSAGYLRIYGPTKYYGDIGYAASKPTANRQYKLPDANGTFALDLSNSFTGTALTGGTLNRCTGTIAERPSVYTNGREYYIYGRLTITSFVRTGSNPYIEFQTSFRPSHNLYGDTGIRFDADVAKPEKIAVNLSTAGVLTISNTETHFNMPTNSVRVIWLFPMLALVYK